MLENNIILFTVKKQNFYGEGMLARVDKKKQKAAFAGIIFIIVALIWTSLYMAFTEVGVASSINGVQGRYFIPLLFLGLSMFATPKIKCSWNKEKFYPVILIAMSLILSFETYSQIIVNSCG